MTAIRISRYDSMKIAGLYFFNLIAIHRNLKIRLSLCVRIDIFNIDRISIDKSLH